MTSLVERARSLVPIIAGHAATVERERRLPADLLAALREAGLFRLLLPARLDGLQAEPIDAFDVIEAVSAGDASTGWCVMIGATAGMSAAWLEPAAARVVHASPDTITGGVFAPLGRARRDGDGWRVDGRWPWFSGHAHCDWLAAGCLLDGIDAPAPVARMMFFRAADAVSLDGWQVSGLSGTGSGEVAVSDLHVPAAFSISLTEPPHDDGALYRMPPFGLLAMGVAAVMLGNARAAIDDLVTLAAARRPQGSRRVLADRATVQAEVARADAALRAARAGCASTLAAAWTAVTRGDALDVDERARLRASATFAVRTAADVARSMYDLGGGASVFLSHPLQRRFRDAHVGTAHAMVAPATWELAGRVRLGLPTDATLL